MFQADEAFHIGEAASRESYLKMEKIIEVAIQSGAQVMSKCDIFIWSLLLIILFIIYYWKHYWVGEGVSIIMIKITMNLLSV